MADWLIEKGIGEDRALLIEGERIIAAKLLWPSECSAGTVLSAKITAKKSGASRAVCISPEGTEINVSGLPRDTAEGSSAQVLITREPMAERDRLKRAQGRFATSDVAASKTKTVLENGKQVPRFPAGAWEEAWALASDQEMSFHGGSLVFSVTPAMILIDIDGHGTPKELSLAAIPALATAIRQLDLGGSIGIDFPTVEIKADRKAVDQALTDALEGWPHEQTAMNGFGFVQIISRLETPSLLHRLTYARAAASARMLLRKAEMVAEPGAILLVCHPGIAQHLSDTWLSELRKRTGREVRIEHNPGLALDGGFAQAVPL